MGGQVEGYLFDTRQNVADVFLQLQCDQWRARRPGPVSLKQNGSSWTIRHGRKTWREYYMNCLKRIIKFFCINKTMMGHRCLLWSLTLRHAPMPSNEAHYEMVRICQLHTTRELIHIYKPTRKITKVPFMRVRSCFARTWTRMCLMPLTKNCIWKWRESIHDEFIVGVTGEPNYLEWKPIFSKVMGTLGLNIPHDNDEIDKACYRIL